MNEQEVITRQAIKIERLEAENADMKARMSRAHMHIICVGGPLNDNRLRYSKEQLVTFSRIDSELRD